MGSTYSRDSYLRSTYGSSFSTVDARKIDKHINSMATGNLSYHWVDSNGSLTYFNH